MPVEFGFIRLSDTFGQRVAQIGVDVVWSAVEETVAEYNRVVNLLMGGIVERTTAAQERFMLPGVATLEPLDEFGNPLPRKTTGFYTVAFPLHRAGYAWGTNRETRALLTVEEVNRELATARQADMDWLLRHMLAAIVDNVAWVHNDPQFGALTIQPLANNDAVLYPRRGALPPAIDDHYAAQAAGIADLTNPYPAIFAELNEHPSNRVSPTSPVVSFVASGLVAATEGLAMFRDLTSPLIIPGVAMDRAAPGVQAQLRFGDRVMGVLGNSAHVAIEWGALPAGYILSMATGAGPILKQREQPAAELQGLFPEANDVDGNRREERLIRICGFGVANRIAGHVQQIGNAAYQIPAGFNAPLAV